jgi:purine-binding chemotaxis protein CheW
MTTALETSATELDQQIGLSSDGRQYLTFTLGEEHYGVDILRVQEIKGYTAVTRLPNTLDYIRGVLNLRGTVIPIVDLRMKFGLPAVENSASTVIIVVEIQNRTIGIIVDAVSDVLNVAGKDIRATPEFGAKIDTSFIRHIVKSGDKLIMVLDIDRVLSMGDLVQVAAAAV